MIRTLQLPFCGILLLALLATGRAHAADTEEQARERYERAVRLYEDGVYDAALVELNRAYELRPSFKLLYNIAQVRLAMKDYAAALETYQQYLREGGERVPAERKKQVQDEIARLEQRVARLSITSDVSGAEVLIDDVPVGTTPLASPVLVNSGVRRVLVRDAEHGAQSVRVSVAGGDKKEVSLTLTPARPASAPPAPVDVDSAALAATPRAAAIAATTAPAANDAVSVPTRDDEPRASPRLTRAIAWSGTAALAAAAAGLAVGAKLREGKLEDARNQPNASAADLRDKSDKAANLGVATDVLTATAVVAAGVSLWLTLRSPRSDDSRRARLGVARDGFSLRTEF